MLLAFRGFLVLVVAFSGFSGLWFWLWLLVASGSGCGAFLVHHVFCCSCYFFLGVSRFPNDLM